MKKANNVKNIKQKKKASQQNKTPDLTDSNKRKTLSTLRNSAIGLVVAGGVGAYLYQAYLADIEERNLTKIGRGTPTIVQIHDPNCTLCAALQKATRSALSNFDEGVLDYRVANVKTQDGSQFAARYNAQHVTLLLFDKRGRLQNTLQGVRQEEELVMLFTALAESR